MTEPVKVFRKEAELILRDTMKDILRNHFDVEILREPSKMKVSDVIANRHLYERLGTAMAALGALRGYEDLPKGFEIKD
jgi:hypothetical protein